MRIAVTRGPLGIEGTLSGGSVIAGVRKLPGRGKRLQTANAVGRANLGVECPDQLVGVNNYVLEQAAPIIRIPLFVEFLESLPLLFDPRVILEVVYGLPLLVSEFLEIVQASMCQTGPRNLRMNVCPCASCLRSTRISRIRVPDPHIDR